MELDYAEDLELEDSSSSGALFTLRPLDCFRLLQCRHVLSSPQVPGAHLTTSSLRRQALWPFFAWSPAFRAATGLLLLQLEN